ncbi:MAG: response regulator [Candidatus Thiodiazotropha sp. (ex Clathrolucina costata)]|nr:response regulator [Candidatus Thiodiazotropha taylori]
MNTYNESHNFKVVVVDDDIIQTRPFLIEMESRGIEVIAFNNADECVEFINSGVPIALFIVDIMLRSRGYYSPELTGNYQLTGLSLSRDIRNGYNEIPIILFTNTARKDLVEEIRRVSDLIGNCVLIQKHTITEMGQFAGIVEYVLRNGVKDITSKSLWERIKENVFFKPSVFGVGIDVKGLSKK